MYPFTTGRPGISGVGAAGLRTRTSEVFGVLFCFYIGQHKCQNNSAALYAGTKDLLMEYVGNWTQRDWLIDMMDQMNSICQDE